MKRGDGIPLAGDRNRIQRAATDTAGGDPGRHAHDQILAAIGRDHQHIGGTGSAEGALSAVGYGHLAGIKLGHILTEREDRREGRGRIVDMGWQSCDLQSGDLVIIVNCDHHIGTHIVFCCTRTRKSQRYLVIYIVIIVLLRHQFHRPCCAIVRRRKHQGHRVRRNRTSPLQNSPLVPPNRYCHICRRWIIQRNSEHITYRSALIYIHFRGDDFNLRKTVDNPYAFP